MMQQKERLEKQLDFIREIDKEKEIFRQTYLADASRKENDAKFVWFLFFMTFFLCERVCQREDRRAKDSRNAFDTRHSRD